MCAATDLRIGILAVQGNAAEHQAALYDLGVQTQWVRHPQALQGLQGLIIPGGESTTMLHFLQQNDFLTAIERWHASGGVLFGTCAGAILLAKTVQPAQTSLGLIDISVERNAFGSQKHSHIGQGVFVADNSACTCAFIRAPSIVSVGPDVNVLVEYKNTPVAVAQDRVMVATYHPELSGDRRLHQGFITLCINCKERML